MMVRLVLATTFAISGAAFAQGTPGPAPTAPTLGPPRTAGQIVAVDKSSFTLKGDDGVEWRLILAPNLRVLTIRPIEHAQIKAGMGAVASNKNLPDGKYEVTVLRVSPPDFPNLNQGRNPNAQAGTTNVIGTIANTTRTSAGYEMDFAYPGGTLHAFMPPNVAVNTTQQVDRSLLKVGARVSAQFDRMSDGTLQTPAVLVWKPAP